MKFVKVIKAEEFEKENVKEELQTILKKIEQEKDLYTSEIVYLQDHKDDIKKLFPNEQLLWQWADIPEEEWNRGASLKKKSGESYGWVVNPEDAWDKLQLWIDTVGAEAALDDIAKAMGTEELSSCLAFIFRNNDFKEGCSDFESEDEENSEDK